MKNHEAILTSIPHEPGVYVYKNTAGKIIYVGKAKDLRKRITQYFQKNIDSPKTIQLVSEIASIDTVTTTSEFDAILLEAKLIRSNLPKYNVVLRDDKSPLYICLTLAEELPKVIFLRKSSLKQYEAKKNNVIYGPLQSPKIVRTIMRQLRTVVPYCTQKIRNGKPCFYTHIGLCSPCASVIAKLEGSTRKNQVVLYRKNIRRLKDILEGKSKIVINELEKQLQKHVKNLAFEHAQEILNKQKALTHIATHQYDPQVFIDTRAEDIYSQELEHLKNVLQPYFPTLEKLSRIECFDISHLAGSAMVASMVVLTDGKPDKPEYRRFRITTVRGISDVQAMREVLLRRLRHDEWQKPDFILIDGGKPQVSAVRDIVTSIPFAGLAKRFEEVVVAKNNSFVTVRLPHTSKGIHVLERIRNEAHRFAITYNRLLRNKSFLVDL